MMVSTPDPGHGLGVGAARLSWMAFGLGIASAGAVLAVLFWPEITGAYRVWTGSTAFSHCFLVVPIALYMVWERRLWLVGAAPRPEFRALALLPPLSLAWLFVAVLGVLEAQQFVLMAIVQVTLLTVMGWPLYRRLLAPLLYLFFLVPSGEFLVPWLQDFTAWFVVRLLRLVGIPVFSDGILIEIPEGNFIVAEACAGLRFLIASVAFGAFFSTLAYRSWRRRLVFIGLSIVVPIFANGLRAFGIIYLAHLTGDAVAVEADHIIYGWGFFSAVMLLLIFIGMRFANRGRQEAPAQGAVASAPAPMPAVALAATLAVALAALGPVYALFLEAPQWRFQLATAAAPQAGPSWRTADDAQDSWQPVVIGPDREFRDAFAGEGGGVHRYVALYAARGRHNNLVRGQNRITDEASWRRSTLGTARIPLRGREVTVNTAEIHSEGHNRLVWYFYVVDGTVTASALHAKLRQARSIVSGSSDISAFVAIAADQSDPAAPPTAALTNFMAAMQPMNEYLDTVKEQAVKEQAASGLATPTAR